MEFGEKVKKIMLESGINQKELSKRSGVSEASLCRYISGSLKPRIDIVSNIAKVFGLKASDLLGDEKRSEISIYDETISVVTRNRNKLSNEEKAEIVKILFGGN